MTEKWYVHWESMTNGRLEGPLDYEGARSLAKWRALGQQISPVILLKVESIEYIKGKKVSP